MKIKIITILILLVVLGAGLGYLYYSTHKADDENLANKSWDNSKKQADALTTFHFNIQIEGKSDKDIKYTQTSEGSWQSPDKVSGQYHFKSAYNEINRDYIVIGDMVFAKDTGKEKWIIFQRQDFPEAIYYTPKDIMNNVADRNFSKKEVVEGKKTSLFEANLARTLRIDDGGITLVKLWLGKENLIKAELSGTQESLKITKSITFSEMNKKINIEAPSDEEIMK